MTEESFREEKPKGISRRTVVKGAAWSVPVIAAAVAVPARAASGDINVGDFSLDGTCGALGLLGVGFDLTAGAAEALPTGTVVTITTSGIANIGLFTVTGGLAEVTAIGSTGNSVVLQQPLAAGATLSLRTTVSLGIGSRMDAVVGLPDGYVAGAGAKDSGNVRQLAVLCDAD